MEDDSGFIVVMIGLLFFVGGCMAGSGVTSTINEERLVEKGLAHYDQKTKEFTLHEPCPGTED